MDLHHYPSKDKKWRICFIQFPQVRIFKFISIIFQKAWHLPTICTCSSMSSMFQQLRFHSNWKAKVLKGVMFSHTNQYYNFQSVYLKQFHKKILLHIISLHLTMSTNSKSLSMRNRKLNSCATVTRSFLRIWLSNLKVAISSPKMGPKQTYQQKYIEVL